MATGINVLPGEMADARYLRQCPNQGRAEAVHFTKQRKTDVKKTGTAKQWMKSRPAAGVIKRRDKTLKGEEKNEN